MLYKQSDHFLIIQHLQKDELAVPIPKLKPENLLFAVFAAVLFSLLNVLHFISVAASPIIRDDAWYFLSSQVQPWIEHGFSWTDIFVKRGLTDHAQPLNKLSLFVNYNLFGLDFKYEALFGFIGFVAIILLCLSFFVKKTISQSVSWVSTGFFLLAILTLTSLNSTELYTWPLVTFSYLPLFLALMLPFLVWRFLECQSTFIPIILAFVVFLLIGDTASIIAWVSLTAAIVLTLICDSEVSRKRSLIWIAGSALLVAGYFVLLNAKFMGGSERQNPGGQPLDFLNINIYLDLVRIVFSSSLVHQQHLTAAGSYQKVLSWLIALPVFYCFTLHFFLLIFQKRRQTSIDIFVTFILVYASCSIAAIVVGRVPEYGIDYLHQPRYVLVYQLIPFALFIKYCFCQDNNRHSTVIRKGIVAITLPFMLCTQFYFSVHAYAAVPWIEKWVDGQANAISDYVSNPGSPAGNCTSYSSPVCKLPEVERNKLLKLMIDNQLNLFNQEFQWRHKIFPQIKQEVIPISGWGPQIMSTQSPDGVWIKLLAPILSADAKVSVAINDNPISDIVVEHDVITFYLPVVYKTTPGIYQIEYTLDGWKSKILVGHIEIKN